MVNYMCLFIRLASLKKLIGSSSLSKGDVDTLKLKFLLLEEEIKKIGKVKL
jgi:hypothetical protein